MSSYALYAEAFFLVNQVVGPGYLMVTEGRFGEFSTDPPAGVEIKDYGDCWVAPGLVDTHIHGFKGSDVMDGTLEALETIAEGLLACGVTSFLPTTLTADRQTLLQVSQLIGEHHQEVAGAKIQGIFFEGPFFTETHKGAQNPSYFSDPDSQLFQEWQTAAQGLIKKIALAPERAGAPAFIRELTEKSVVVALAHSAATYQEAQTAVEAGASIFVHTYNGMSGLNHREPGMVGTAMTTDTVAEVICDGQHVHPVAVDALIKAKGSQKIALVTDCMRAGGMPDGDYQLGEFPVHVEQGAARLKEGGSLAGSVLELLQAVENVTKWNVVTASEAFKMASQVPAESCKIDHVCGSIRPGRDADFILVTPKFKLIATYLDGKLVYTADEGESDYVKTDKK